MIRKILVLIVAIIVTSACVPARNISVASAEIKATGPEKVLQNYFKTLGSASNLSIEQSMTTGSIGAGKEPYTAAYKFWSTNWRKSNNYAKYLSSWEGTVNLQFLKVFPAGRSGDQRRFFVETRNIEFPKGRPYPGIFYYTGFYKMILEDGKWVISEGKMNPENLTWELGGHQPWRDDPVSVALTDGLGVSINSPPGKPILSHNPNGTVTVKFVDAESKAIHTVTLYKPTYGYWLVLDKS